MKTVNRNNNRARSTYIYFLFAAFFLLSLSWASYAASTKLPDLSKPRTNFWDVRSIDTMKYSRDRARELLADPSLLDQTVNQQLDLIAASGTNYVSIATPYDREFLPVLETWVRGARFRGLQVWFRGNWSGWEQWFGYAQISADAHMLHTKSFIREHTDLFEDGDLFDPCPECENGGLGDPRFTGSSREYTVFLQQLYASTAREFDAALKDVTVVLSMNGDVARLIMTADTAKSFGGTVTVDHYVADAETLAGDVRELAETVGGTVYLGEFGAPVRDIHGEMNERESADWMDGALSHLAGVPEIRGINYWVSVGGSTHLWSENGGRTQRIDILEKYYNPDSIYGLVLDEYGAPIPNARVATDMHEVKSTKFGYYELPYLPGGHQTMTVSAEGYVGKTINLTGRGSQINVLINSENRSFVSYISGALRITASAMNGSVLR